MAKRPLSAAAARRRWPSPWTPSCASCSRSAMSCGSPGRTGQWRITTSLGSGRQELSAWREVHSPWGTRIACNAQEPRQTLPRTPGPSAPDHHPTGRCVSHRHPRKRGTPELTVRPGQRGASPKTQIWDAAPPCRGNLDGTTQPVGSNVLLRPLSRLLLGEAFIPHCSWVWTILETAQHLHFRALGIRRSLFGGGNGNPLPCSCLENPRGREVWWAAVYEVAQSRTWLKRLSSSTETWLMNPGYHHGVAWMEHCCFT